MSKIISLTGDLGSGKSTVSAILCKTMNYEYVYTGQIQRRIAERYSMTTNELNVYAETHPEIDQEIDNTFKSLVDAENLIVDSRLAWYFIPNSFKVFLKTNIVVSAQRISGDKERINENYTSIQEAAMKIVERKKSEVKRYKLYYGVDCLDYTNYDLIIDTTEVPPKDVCEIILSEFEKFGIMKKNYTPQAFVSPRNLYPTLATDQSNDITVTNVDSFDYILSGHAKVAAATKEKLPLVRVNYVSDRQTGNFHDKELIAKWQQDNDFKYLIEP
ncbi:MAG: (d)CMP kinase [Bacteroidota bacterium]